MTWGEEITKLEGQGFKDKLGHPLEHSAIWQAIKNSFIDVWDEQIPEEFLDSDAGDAEPTPS